MATEFFIHRKWVGKVLEYNKLNLFIVQVRRYRSTMTEKLS